MSSKRKTGPCHSRKKRVRRERNKAWSRERLRGSLREALWEYLGVSDKTPVGRMMRQLHDNPPPLRSMVMGGRGRWTYTVTEET